MIFQKFSNFNRECRIISRDLVCSKFTTARMCCKIASHFRLYNTSCSGAVASPFIKKHTPSCAECLRCMHISYMYI